MRTGRRTAQNRNRMFYSKKSLLFASESPMTTPDYMRMAAGLAEL